MDPVTALGVASAIAGFVQLGVSVAKRLKEYSDASAGDLPKSLESITVQLPLLINALSHMKSESQLSKYDPETRCILQGVIVGCLKLVRELDEIATKLQPKQGESVASKLKKVLKSLKVEDRIVEIDRGLKAHIQVLILHRVVDSNDIQIEIVEEIEYFVVREQQAKAYVERETLMVQLDNNFHDVVTGQKQRPEVVALHGPSQAGKSQLALAYCHQRYKSGQFRTVFWLNATTPETLKRSLESVASEIRRTRLRARDENLQFLQRFFSERWHPWLLVLDNYDSDAFKAESVATFLPEKGYGAILLTSRNSIPVDLGNSISVYQFLTLKEQSSLRRQFTDALESKDLGFVEKAVAEGFDVNSLSKNVWNDQGPSVLNVAADAGFDRAFQLLLDHGADVHLNKAHTSALGSAVLAGSIGIVKLYLDHEEKVNYDLEQHSYDIVFRDTITKSYLDILKLLLEKRPGRYDKNNKDVIEGCQNAAEHGHIEVLRHLHTHGHYPDSDQAKATILSAAIKRRKLELARFIVDEVKLDVNAFDNDGETALYAAVSLSSGGEDDQLRDTFVKMLLAAAADPDISKRWNRRTPLHLAAAYASVSTIELLLKAGANVTLEDDDHYTALLLAGAGQYKRPAVIPTLTDVEISDAAASKKYYTDALFYAARTGDRDLAVHVLKKCDVDAVEGNNEVTPLLLAISDKHIPLARLLVRNGASPAKADKKGRTPLLLASTKGLDLVVRDLVKAKDSPGLETSDEKENTPLLLATQENHVKLVELLLKLGAEKDAMNIFGETALDVAEEKGFQSIVALLDT